MFSLGREFMSELLGSPQNTDSSELGNHVDGLCSLLVQFTGPGYKTNNGPGESTDNPSAYGLGFTVSGYVADGAIGRIERSDPYTNVPVTMS
jgi:hypothetical protein